MSAAHGKEREIPWLGILLTALWINASEVFRYFVVVIPRTRAFLPMVPDVAPMNLTVFGIWFAWDTVLTVNVVVLTWLAISAMGKNKKSILIGGLLSWSQFFLLFWIAMVNMNLSPPHLLLLTLPLSLLEMVIAAWIFTHFVKADSVL